MNAIIKVRDGEVNSPSRNNLVTVEVEIQLPCREVDEYLVEELVFGEKVYILGECLNWNWGCLYETEERRYRYKTFKVEAETFQEATRIGISKAKAVLEPLRRAVMEREQKVQKAGEFKVKEITFKLNE